MNDAALERNRVRWQCGVGLVVLAMGIGSIRCYEILAENGTMNTAHYLEPKSHGTCVRIVDNQKHTVLLPYDNVRPHRHASITSM